ncbi:unnamed protein product [Calypogeia fissa]
MDSNSPVSVEWERAQQVKISVDLIIAAKQELHFLAIVDSTPALKNGWVLLHAVKRYLNCWLPLASKYTPRSVLQPPLDCAWVWHCHKLNPVQYMNDCFQLFGRLVDVGAPGPNVTNGERLAASIWAKAYPDVPYHFIRRGGQAPGQPQQKFDDLPSKITIDYDLIGAMERQTSFYYQVCRPWMYEDRYLQVALERYRGFLHLIKLAKEKQAEGSPRPFLVPTYDIDLLWHSHQLCPTAYRADTVKCMDSVLDHDDSDTNREVGAKLQTSFVDTCEQWLSTFGTVYEHAGSLYRGSQPARSAPPNPTANSGEVVMGYPVKQKPKPPKKQNLSQRQTVQVNLVVLGASDVHPTSKIGRRSFYFIRVSALRICPGLKLTTAPLECSSAATQEVAWNEGFSLQAELSTEGLRMELMTFTGKATTDGKTRRFLDKFQFLNILKSQKKPKCIGEVSIEWQRDLLNSTAGLSVTKWVSLEPKGKFPNGPPKLHFSVSITPPTPAPHIFRMLPAPVTDDNGLQVAKLVPADKVRQEGRWLTRTAVDHTGQERFVVRTRWAKGAKIKDTQPQRVFGDETVVKVHEGALKELLHNTRNYQKERLLRVPSVSVGEAYQLKVDPFLRTWSLFDGAATLTVHKPADNGGLSCELEAVPGPTSCQMRLLGGRWLDYEVAGGKDRNEIKYLTLIRYTPDAPMGKATALINWQTASIEVKPEEDVVLVLLIANAISTSLVNMQYRPSNETTQLKNHKHSDTDGHLGAIQLQRNGLSDQWRRHSTSIKPYYWEANHSWLLYSVFWWELTSLEFTQMYGAGCGGGACTAGSCGGGACSSAGGCGGGACYGGYVTGCGGGCGGFGGGCG